MLSRINNNGRIGGFEGTSGNTGSCIKFGMKSSITITSLDKFSQFLKSCKATTYLDANQSTIIEIGKAGPDTVKTSHSFTVGGERVEIILHHCSYNYGAEADAEHAIINLNGNENIISLTLFTKSNLALAFG